MGITEQIHLIQRLRGLEERNPVGGHDRETIDKILYIKSIHNGKRNDGYTLNVYDQMTIKMLEVMHVSDEELSGLEGYTNALDNYKRARDELSRAQQL